MSKDWLTIGSTPSDEDCVQTINPDYDRLSRQECERFRQLVLKICGQPPNDTVWVGVKKFPYECDKCCLSGFYREVVVFYDNTNQEGMDYAYWVESHSPQTWDQKETALWSGPR